MLRESCSPAEANEDKCMEFKPFGDPTPLFSSICVRTEMRKEEAVSLFSGGFYIHIARLCMHWECVRGQGSNKNMKSKEIAKDF